MENAIQLFSSRKCLNACSMPPFLIVKENHSIGEISFLLKKNDYENWSIAMRQFLFDLKVLEIRSLRAYLSFYKNKMKTKHGLSTSNIQ